MPTEREKAFDEAITAVEAEHLESHGRPSQTSDDTVYDHAVTDCVNALKRLRNAEPVRAEAPQAFTREEVLRQADIASHGDEDDQLNAAMLRAYARTLPAEGREE